MNHPQTMNTVNVLHTWIETDIQRMDNVLYQLHEQDRHEKECIAWTIASVIIVYTIIIVYVLIDDFEDFALFYLFGYNMIQASVCFALLLLVLFSCVSAAVLLDIYMASSTSQENSQTQQI